MRWRRLRRQEYIYKFATGLENPEFAKAVLNAADAIFHKMYPTAETPLTYPYQGFDVKEVVEKAQVVAIGNKVLDFRKKWGIQDVISEEEFRQMLDGHKYGEQDLDDSGKMGDVVFKGSLHYTESADDPEVRKLMKLKYRNALRNAIYYFADDMVKE